MVFNTIRLSEPLDLTEVIFTFDTVSLDLTEVIFTFDTVSLDLIRGHFCF